MDQPSEVLQMEYPLKNIFYGLEIFRPENTTPICSAALQFLLTWIETRDLESRARIQGIDSIHFSMYQNRIEIGAFRVHVILEVTPMRPLHTEMIGLIFSGKILPSGVVIFSSKQDGIVPKN